MKPVLARGKVGVLRLALVDYLRPVPILALQLVTESNPLRRDEAECRVIDPDIAHERGQSQAGRGIVNLSVRDNLLDVHRRWESVERRVTPVQATRIDHVDTASRQVPQSSIRGLSDTRAEAAGERNQPDPVRIVENGGLDRPLRTCAHASNSGRAMRTKPQAMYSQIE